FTDEFARIFSSLESDSTVRGVVFASGKPTSFLAGADISMLDGVETAEQGATLARGGQDAMSRIADFPKPVVAAIHGAALGGGLELALACHERVATDSPKTKLGLPEVQLGIHPGFGGTVRAIQRAGVRPAMQLMLTGAPINPSKARRIGLIDATCGEQDWRDKAVDILNRKPAETRAPFVERLLGTALVRPFIRPVLEKQVRSKARKDHYPAPYAIIDLWARHGGKGDTAYRAEARSIAELMCTPTSRNLVRVFFLQNQLKAQGGEDVPQVKHVHVVGAGVMGGDIAAWCALRGMQVTLEDRELKYIEPAMERAAKLYAKRVRNDAKRAETSARLRPDVGGDGAADADLVIEAIFEDLDAKQTLYKRLLERMKPGALLATNTSSIPLEDLRAVVTEPSRFIGLHFFNPVAQLPLVEVIRCADTERDALDIGIGFVKAIGKLPLECGSAPGFVVNRILAPYMAEAMQLIEEGVPLAAIDKAAEKFGMPMGPVELVDSVGLDVALNVSKILGAAMNRTVPARLVEMVEAGKLGRKSGEGFYRWEDGKAQKPEAGSGAPADVEDRLILPMVNEAVAVFADGVVDDVDLLDAGVIFGTGFAPFRGGPLKYARDRGVDATIARLEALAETYDDRFKPYPGWSRIDRN
ncbi:MAG: 3-hydroxyacyl-CoA dehydrogenase NAD-binding domain-containing protein, partial [Pseudomonadota bacterium]